MMDKRVIDSSVLIDYLRGRAPAVEYLEPLRKAGALITHVAVAAEVLVGVRNSREQADLTRLLDEFRTIGITQNDSLASIDLLTKHRLASGVGWLDCLIAASCLRLGLPIVTLNTKHFAVLEGLKVVRPY